MEYVELRDGGTVFSPLIGRYCQKSPSTQFSTDSIIFVKFFTNIKVPRNGFKAKISLAYCGGTIKGYKGEIQNPSRLTKDPKVNCTWHIIGPLGHYLAIKFIELDISTNKIIISDVIRLFNNGKYKNIELFTKNYKI